MVYKQGDTPETDILSILIAYFGNDQKMPSPFGSLVALAKDKTLSGRRRLAAEFGGAYLLHSNTLSDKERGLGHDILFAVLKDIALDLRCELSVRLSQEKDVPNRLIMALAKDVIEVAQPVLQFSPDLSEKDLLELIFRQSGPHRSILALRNNLPEAAIHALAETRNKEVAEALLGNSTIRISQSDLKLMASQALEHASIANAMAGREEITSEIAEQLYWLITSELRQQIQAQFHLDPVKLDLMLGETVMHAVARQGSALIRRNVCNQLIASGRVDADLLITVLKNRGETLFLDLFSGLSGFSVKTITLLCHLHDVGPLALICRALSFGKSETGTLIMLISDRIGHQPQLDPTILAAGMTTYSRLTEGDARTVMWQWQSNPVYLNELEGRRGKADDESLSSGQSLAS